MLCKFEQQRKLEMHRENEKRSMRINIFSVLPF